LANLTGPAAPAGAWPFYDAIRWFRYAPPPANFRSRLRRSKLPGVNRWQGSNTGDEPLIFTTWPSGELYGQRPGSRNAASATGVAEKNNSAETLRFRRSVESEWSLSL
jgi:hypothetical protein